jgi:hypothetical protein
MKERIRVIRKLPGDSAKLVEIANTLSSLQAQVGGYVESVMMSPNFAILCNEDGRLMGMEPNCRLFGIDFAGPILIVGIDGEDFDDVSNKTISLFRKKLQWE